MYFICSHLQPLYKLYLKGTVSMILTITSEQNRLVQKVAEGRAHTTVPHISAPSPHLCGTQWPNVLEGLKSWKENSLCKHTSMFCLFRSLNKVTWERHLFKISPDYSAPIRLLCRSIYSLRDIFVSDQIMWEPSLGVPSELLLLPTMWFLI